MAYKWQSEAGPKGLQGGMGATKYISMTKASKATATRNLKNLVERGVFVVIGGRRSNQYVVDLRWLGRLVPFLVAGIFSL